MQQWAADISGDYEFLVTRAGSFRSVLEVRLAKWRGKMEKNKQDKF